MTTRKVSVVLVGVSGYGNTYLRELLYENNRLINLTGVVDIAPKNSNFYQELIERNIPIYHSLRDFYKVNNADLAIVSTPIHLHSEHSCEAMMNGSNVLCEKPIAIDYKDIKKMKQTSKDTGKFVAIGFNWSFAPSIQQLKNDILAGEFGKAKRFKSITLWPRTKDYYNRSPWAGKKYSAQGDMIYDSIASNSAAHYLHHLLYLNGEEINKSAQISHLTAELYKVNNIDTFDTCAIKMITESNVEVYYYATHAVEEVRNPQYVLEFEEATISYNQDSEPSDIIVKKNDGSMKKYEDPNQHRFAKLEICIQAIIRGDHRILCGIEAAIPHVDSIHAIHQSNTHPLTFPDEIIKYNQASNLLTVVGLGNTLMTCYKNWCLPFDLNIKWSKRGKNVKIQ